MCWHILFTGCYRVNTSDLFSVRRSQLYSKYQIGRCTEDCTNSTIYGLSVKTPGLVPGPLTISPMNLEKISNKLITLAFDSSFGHSSCTRNMTRGSRLKPMTNLWSVNLSIFLYCRRVCASVLHLFPRFCQSVQPDCAMVQQAISVGGQGILDPNQPQTSCSTLKVSQNHGRFDFYRFFFFRYTVLKNSMK